MNWSTADGVSLILTPPVRWVTHLRRDCQVWLVKEGQLAKIEYPWEPPEGWSVCGQILLSRQRNAGPAVLERWYVGDDGGGLDGRPLLAPVVGHLPNRPVELSPTDIQRYEQQLHFFKQRLVDMRGEVLRLRELIIQRIGPLPWEDPDAQ